VSLETLCGILLCLGLAGYLFYALLFPERLL
jgi:K+-transporting ATPase KdpF subunit